MLAAQTAGLSTVRILRRHILPNVITQAIVFAMSDIVLVILAIVTLGYLGLGVQPPTPDWGRMIADGQPYLTTTGNWRLSRVSRSSSQPSGCRCSPTVSPTSCARNERHDPRRARPARGVPARARPRPRRRRRLLRPASRRGPRHRRGIRLGQDDGAAGARRPPPTPSAPRRRRDPLRGRRPLARVGGTLAADTRSRDRDDLPRALDRAKPGDARGRPDRRRAAHAARPQPAAGAGARDRADAAGGHPGPRSALPGLSSRALGWHAAARDDRDRPLAGAEGDPLRRADHRPRRDDSGPDPEAAGIAAQEARGQRRLRLSRPRGGRPDVPARRGHVRGPGGRDRAYRRGLSRAPTPVHVEPAAVGAGFRRRPGRGWRRSPARHRISPHRRRAARSIPAVHSCKRIARRAISRSGPSAPTARQRASIRSSASRTCAGSL